MRYPSILSLFIVLFELLNETFYVFIFYRNLMKLIPSWYRDNKIIAITSTFNCSIYYSLIINILLLKR